MKRMLPIFPRFTKVVFVALLFCAQNSFAQTNNQQLPLDRILQQKELEMRQEKILKKPAIQEVKKLDEETQTQKTGKYCIEVSDVIFADANLLSKRQQKRLAKSIIGKCLYSNDIGIFLNKITNHYIDKGYTNARVYFDKYNPQDKTLHLKIAEGKIASIKLNNIKPQKTEDKPKQDQDKNSNQENLDQKKSKAATENKIITNSFFEKLQIFFAFPSHKGKIFNMKDFEQGVNNMNRLRSNNAVIESRPSLVEGESDIIINNYKNNNSWQASAGYDNSGSKSSGVYNATYALSKDNLLSLNDNINISQIKSARSETNIISATIPFGYYSFTYSDSSNKYSSFTNNGVRIDGTSTNHDLSLDRLLFKGKTHEFNLTSNLNFRNQTTKQADVTTIKSQRLSTGRIGLDYTARFNNLTINLGSTYSKGLTIHDAIDDKKDFSSPLQKDAARAQFEKYTYNLNLYKTINKYLSYNLQGTIQHSPDALYSSELIYVGGGKYSVRGLQYDGISGSKGGFARNDLTLDIGQVLTQNKIQSQNLILNQIIKELKNLRFGVFYDSGYTRAVVNKDDFVKTEYISGTGLGLKYYGKYLNGDISYAKNLRAPKYTQIGNNYKNSSIYFGVTGKYQW